MPLRAISSIFIKYCLRMTALLMLSACGGGGGDNDNSGNTDTLPALSVADTSVNEGQSGNANLIFTISLDKSSTDVVTVDYATSDGSATAGSDYAAASGTITFNPGETTTTISISVFGDTTVENDETITLTLSNAAGATINTNSATGTIINDDQPPPPIISISDAGITEGNSGTSTLSFTVSLSGASSSNVTVDYITSDALANSADDYVATSGTLTLTAGSTESTIDVVINGDTDNESDETFTITLSNPNGATLGNSVATGTILNDDGETIVVISVADNSVVEGNSGTTDLVFTVNLSSPSQTHVTVDYATSNATALSPTDYTATSGTLTIPAGETSGTITVTIKGDTTIESNESFNLTLSNPSVNALLGDSTAIGTIENDDFHTINVVNRSIKEGDAGSSLLTFYVNAGYGLATGAISFDYTTADGSATAGSDYTAKSGTISFAKNERVWTHISISIAGDTDIESDETFSLQFSNPVGVNLGTTSATGTIINDDADISIANARVSEGDSGTTTLAFVVSLDQAVSGNVSVDYTTTVGTATENVDYIATSGTVTILEGDTQANINITVNGDTEVEQHEIIPIILSNVIGNAILGRSVAFGFIDNDDGGTAVSPAKTGQQTCYDESGTLIDCSGTGQDGEYQNGAEVPVPRFMDNGNNTITDNLTGLIWPADGNFMTSRDPGFDSDGIADDGIVTWQTALNYVDKLNQESFLGFNDWRLPNRNELLSLSNYGVSNNATELASNGFSSYGRSYWSSSNLLSESPAGSSAWAVNMAQGYVLSSDKTQLIAAAMYALPVRGGHNSVNAPVPQTGQAQCFNTSGNAISCSGTGQDGEYQLGAPWPASRFVTNADTTITDALTGLIWVADANIIKTRDPDFDTDVTNGDGKVNWQTALNYVAKLNAESYLGHNDWFLPNVNEQLSLINIETKMTSYPLSTGWLYTVGFSNVGDFYWTSDTFLILLTRYAWTVHIGSGQTATPYAGSNPAADKNTREFYVWPARRE